MLGKSISNFPKRTNILKIDEIKLLSSLLTFAVALNLFEILITILTYSMLFKL